MKAHRCLWNASFVICGPTPNATIPARAGQRGRAGATETALRLVNALAWYLQLRGSVRQAARWAGRALAIPGDVSPELRARAGSWEIGISILLGVESKPVSHVRSAIESFDGADDPLGLAMAQWFLGYVLLHVGHLDVSEELAEQSSTGFRSLGHDWEIAVSASLIAHQAILRDNGKTAATAAEEAFAGFRALEDRGGELLTIYPRAVLAEHDKDIATAERLHREGLELAGRLGSARWPANRRGQRARYLR